MANKEEFNYVAMKYLWDWLCSNYDFKRDVIKSRAMFRKNEKIKKEFKNLEDEDLNTISIEAGLAGLKQSSPKNIQLFLNSHYTETCHPIREYLERVSKRRCKGVIDSLANCIVTTNPMFLKKFLIKWFASCVANAMITQGCQNHTCLTFTGAQFAGKTTLFEWLCPKELKDYLYTGEIELGSKDSVWKLSEYWIINLEEQIKSLNRKDANTMKSLMTLPHIKGRRPYGRLEATGNRLANFTASTNDDDFLTDSTGSRRFLCFRILEINEAYKNLSIDEIWSEAFWYWKDNPNSYYINSEDIKELNENNKEFTSITAEEEYIIGALELPNENKAIFSAPSSIISDYLSLKYGTKQHIKSFLVGKALNKLGFVKEFKKVQGKSVVRYKFSLTNSDQAIGELNNYKIEDLPF